MKVVILNDASIARGGATGLSLLQARLLRERKIPVTFIAGDELDNPELNAMGVKHLNLGGTPLMKSPKLRAATQGLYNSFVRNTVVRHIAKFDDTETVYHVHSWSKALTPAVFSALQHVAPRVFIHAHDFFLSCPNGGFMNYPRMAPCALRPLSMNCLVSNCDKRSRSEKAWRVTRQVILRHTLPPNTCWGGVLMIHPNMRPLLEQGGYPPSLLHTLRNPATPVTHTRVRAEAGSYLLYIGRIEAEKGVEDLVEAASRANVELTVVGDGPLLNSMQAAYPKVRFTGWLDRVGMAAEMFGARALVMPSRYPEPFGLVAAEAVLSGLPVIVSESALLSDELVEQRVGWSVNSSNSSDFSQMLSRVMLASADQIAAMSERGFAGDAALSSTPAQWIDKQISIWSSAL